MGRIILYPYNIGSKTCKDLANSLTQKHHAKVLRVRPDGHFNPRYDDTIINWGNSHVPAWDRGYEMWNDPISVAKSVNKLSTFMVLEDCKISHVPYTTSIDVAKGWNKIVERHVLNSYGGKGIVISSPLTVRRAPLYTKFINSTAEYRVHVFNGKVIDYTKKIKRVNNVAVGDIKGEDIRNLDHGWTFIRDVEPRQSVIDLAIDTIRALDLDFGAVDIIRSRKLEKNYVLEVGTAAGLSPIGLEAYTNAILSIA